MPGIGSLVREIDINISEISERKKVCFLSITNARAVSVNYYYRFRLPNDTHQQKDDTEHRYQDGYLYQDEGLPGHFQHFIVHHFTKVLWKL